ncbi:MAG: hypothetical protein KDK78_11915, partial [Chlamydiia bacterium]|nr:hypothetical protein [Chlamydiia bacterium]
GLELQHLWQESPAGKRGYTLVAMHGRGGSMHDFEQLKDIWRLDDLNYLLLQGPDPFFGGWSWYDIPPNPLPGIRRSRKMLGTLLDSLHAKGYARERCFLFGFSQGCLLTFEFGARYPHALAGYVGISGQLYDTHQLIHDMHPAATQKADWLWSAGTLDGHFGIETTRIQAERLRAAGMRLDFVEWPKDHEIDHQEEVWFLRDWVAAHMK